MSKTTDAAGENTLQALTRELTDLTNELKTNKRKKNSSNEPIWKRVMPKGPPAGAYGIGCGMGVGAGLSGGMPLFPLFGPSAKLIFGVGAGCGVGLGFGWGFGKGRFWDKPGEGIVSRYKPGGNAKPPAAGKPGGKAGQVIMR